MTRPISRLLPTVLATATLTLAACGGDDAKPEGTEGTSASATPAPAQAGSVLGPSDVAKVDKADIVEGVPLSGTLQPAVEVRISSPIPEVVDEVLVNEGDHVKKGQVLARFFTSVLAPQAASAEAQARIAAADYERMKNLLAEGAVSPKDVETAELQYRSAQAVEAQARKRLDEATMRASVDGVISERLVESGQRVKDGDHLFTLVNTDQLEFQATVPSQYVSQIRVGAPVALSITGIGDANSVSGKVSRINAAVDPSTRQVKVYVIVANRNHQMVGGLFASGRVVLRESQGALAIPTPGVRRDNDRRYVFVVEGGKVARKDVTVGLDDEIRALTEIRKGLNAGETVIIGPAEGLRAGDAVQVVGQEG